MPSLKSVVPSFAHRVMAWPRPLFRSALDLLYPPRCAACVVRLPSPAAADFCPACEAILEPVAASACQICSEPFPGLLPHGFTCPNCADQTFAFDCAISSWHSSGPLREAIHRFKYGRHLHLRLPLARKLFDTLSDPRLTQPGPPADHMEEPDAPPAESPETIPDWILVPVPLHPRRLRERGFNQSRELALELIRRAPAGMDLRLLSLLDRVKQTTRQAQLDRRERLANLADVYEARKKLPPAPPGGARILLVDDVITTGTTVSECAAVLREALEIDRIAAVSVLRG